MKRTWAGHCRSHPMTEWIWWHVAFTYICIFLFYFIFLAWLFIGGYDGNFPHRVNCCSRVRVPGTGTVCEEQQVNCWRHNLTLCIVPIFFFPWCIRSIKKTKPAFTLLSHLQTDSLLLIRPYLSKLTLSEMHAVMTAGLAGISGTMMGVYISFGVRVMREEEGGRGGICRYTRLPPSNHQEEQKGGVKEGETNLCITYTKITDLLLH